MIKKIELVLENVFEWMKKDLLILSLLILVVALVVRMTEVNILLECTLLGIILIKCFIFSGLYSINGGAVTLKDQFSWKFLQGLPLTKKELMLSLVLSNLFTSIPLFLWILCFWSRVDAMVLHGSFSLTKSIVNLILFFILMSFLGISNQIQHPRREYQRQNADKKFVKFVGKALLIISIVTYALIGTEYLDEKYNINFLEILFKCVGNIEKIVMSWWMAPILIVSSITLYFYILDVWGNEKRSYSPNTWNAKKEYSQIALTCGLLAYAFINIDFKMPLAYRGNLTKATFQKNYKLIEEAISNHENINASNRFGTTPMLVAIREGDLEMVKFLESKGATFNGVIKNRNNKKVGASAILLAIESENLEVLKYIMSKKIDTEEYYKTVGYGPIHKATADCQARMVDYLIKNGSDKDALNERGETPLLVSARFGCFSVAVTLKEAGANFDKNDNSGKSALDLLKKRDKKNSEFEYFLEKNSRLPASAK